MKYYKVTVEKAHQGRGRDATISFYVAAENIVHASAIGRKMPGVKHTKNVLACVPINVDEYLEGRKISAYARAGG